MIEKIAMNEYTILTKELLNPQKIILIQQFRENVWAKSEEIEIDVIIDRW